MPSRGGLRLSVVATACTVGLAMASSASANDVVLWACHGPAGQALGSDPFAGAATYGTGCATEAMALEAGGVRATGDRDFGLSVRPGLILETVWLLRGTSGLGAEGGAGRYSAQYRDAEFDGSATDVSGPVSAPVPVANDLDGGSLRFRVTGDGTAAEVQRVGLTVADTRPPTAATGGYGNNVAGTLHVNVRAKDTGVGLDRAELYVDDRPASSGRFVSGTGGRRCADLTPGDGVVDLPLDNDCLTYGELTLDVDTTRFDDGDHRLTIKLYDAAGNESDVLKDYATTIVNHPNYGSSTATLHVGSGGATPQPGTSGGSGSGGVAGESATSCSSPRLSMELTQKPLRISNGAPVLQYGKRYRFRGRLTCLVKNKRHSAPVRTPIELFSTIGKKTYRKGGATVRSKGAITLILSYKSSRTLVFRYTNADGRRSQVKLKIVVARRSR